MKNTHTVLIVYFIAIVLACILVPWEANYKGVRASRGYAPIWSPPRAGYEDPGFYNYTSVDTGRLAIEIIGITAVAALVGVVSRKRSTLS